MKQLDGTVWAERNGMIDLRKIRLVMKNGVVYRNEAEVKSK